MTFHADHAVGILFAATGGIAVYLGLDYGFGELSEMGPGALPVLLGTTLFVFGITLLMKATLANAGAAAIALIPREEIRPFLAILAALFAFSLLIDRVGLLPSVAAVIGLGWLADKRGRLKELPALTLAIVAIILGIFHFGLGIPFHLFDWSI
ncbi:tripartite tricarboxylate transporter TctB family protein [Neorhizobium sp. T25_13]|uniref:tripartite tricarboxylate transporter TctB family protein n=1 Tax=Neorhizobium sp. T25_13 TaxID=2093830 RepID=UPI00155E4D07|nr:tripartite tricarboxylate transporter TctB family protein [Neorhizobium sp. T25_13]